MRGRTKEIHKELQDLDSLCSPHLEERWIGGNIDLDLLSLFPRKYVKIMEGMEEEGQAIQSQQWRREKPNSWLAQGGRRGIYTPFQKCCRCGPGVDPGQVGEEYPPPGLSEQKSASITGSEPPKSSTQK
jgi:hypothetical protein